MTTRLTVDQLEQMKTHELADLLANVVLLLRRMPDVACSSLIGQTLPDATMTVTPELVHASPTITGLSREALMKKTVADLKKLAGELRLPLPTKAKKDELVTKILARTTSQHSEQFAIHEL